jgi:peptidoglycan/xylan/chitin deacetylase (PgdA/CDA1 family)
MQATRRALRRAVKSTASAADRVRPPREGIVVLVYHRIGGRSSLEMDLSTPMFDDQMGELAASGRVSTLSDALAILTGERDDVEPRAPVVVTFDDGTADFVDEAMPVLVRHRVPATLYLATEFVEEGRAYPDGAAPVSWQGLSDACATGLVDVGSHTHGHRLLDRLPHSETVAELDRSIGLIGDRLGRRARDFAYPKAVAGSPAAERLVRARFRSAALAGTRPNPFTGTDVHRLARSPIQASDGMRWFRRKSTGGMGLEDVLRSVLNRGRYARATT